MKTKTKTKTGYEVGKTYRVNQPNHDWDGMTATLEWRKGTDAWVRRGEEVRRVKLGCLSSKNVVAKSPADTGDKLAWGDEETVVPAKAGRVSWWRASTLWVMGYWRRSF